MPGLTEKASGEAYEPSAAIARAQLAWEESMLRQLEELRAEVQKSPPELLAFRSGTRLQGAEFRFTYWNRPVSLHWPALEAQYLDTGKDCPVFDLSLFLFYLKAADGTSLAERWISFRELPGGAFYHQAFQGYSGDRLAQAIGEKPTSFHLAAKAIGGWQLTSLAEHAYAFQALPRLRLAAVLWPGDEEFPSRASILFDTASSHYMTTDGMAILGSGLVSRIIKAAV
jgi:hypothetical protein